PGFPSNRGDFLIADSCNFAASSDYRTPVQFVPWRSLVPRGPVVTGRAAPRGGAGWGLPAFPAGGAAEVSGVRAGRRPPRSGAQQLGRRRGGPVPSRGASPGHSAAALLVKVSGGEAASFGVWAAQRPARGHAASFPASARS